MNMKNKKRKIPRGQRGMSLVELMVASVVLIVGVLAAALLIPLSIGSNFRNRQQSNSTVIAQMVMERIASVPASTSPTLSLSDCTAAAAAVSTAGSTAGAGAPLLASGDVDYAQAAQAGYSMSYTTCGTSGRTSVYDVRWNVRTLSTYTKLVTVSAKLRGAGTDPKMFSMPVTLRSLTGQGN